MLWGPCASLSQATAAALLLPATWLHFKGALGNQRDGDTQRDVVRPAKLFYIIPRHNRANPNVHTLKQGGEFFVCFSFF